MAAAGVFSLVLVTSAMAADPTGTWKWSTMFNNQTREQTLKLKLPRTYDFALPEVPAGD